MTNLPIIFNPPALNFISSGTLTVNSGTNFIIGTAATTTTVYGLHGLTVEINYEKYLKMAEAGDPMFLVTTEDDTIICLKLMNKDGYHEEEICQDIPEDFDFEFESLLNLAVKLNPAVFQILLARLPMLDELTKIVFKVEDAEQEVTLKELKSLTSA